MTAAATAPRAAFRPEDPDLAGYVILDFAAFDWLEDDEEIIGHPRDPFHRVDIRASSVDVEVALDGVTLASTNGAQLLYETLLPVRYYIPPADVRLDLLEESPKRTVCPYKGQASYWSYPDSDQGRNLAWSYDRTVPRCRPDPRAHQFLQRAGGPDGRRRPPAPPGDAVVPPQQSGGTLSAAARTSGLSGPGAL